MKKALVATILGIAASVATVASSYGQASVFFNTYTSTGYFPVKWSSNIGEAPAGQEGLAVLPTDNIVANLLWQYGSTSGNAGLAIATSADVPGYGPGFILGPAVTTAANYAGGPITFTIQAWVGASFATAQTKGSLTWVETAGFLPGGPPDTFKNLPGPVIVVAPEPTTFALAGLGAATLLIFRRRK